MSVYLAKKDGQIISHSDMIAMRDLDGISKPDRTVTINEWEAAGSVAHVDTSGDIVLGDPMDIVIARKETTELAGEEAKLQGELDGTDWMVIRASERGQILSEIDVALHNRREWCRKRISEIRMRRVELLGKDNADMIA